MMFKWNRWIYNKAGYLNSLAVINKLKDILPTNNPAYTMDVYNNNNNITTYHTNNTCARRCSEQHKSGIKNNLYPIQVVIPIVIK